MIRALVERLPVMVCPRWVDTRTQPIAIDDVLAYLRTALELGDGRGGVFEIGGPEVVSYGDMMREYARLRRLRRFFLSVPVLTPRLSGLWLGLVTPAQARVGRALVDGLRNPTVVRSPAARETFEIRPMPLRDAFQACDRRARWLALQDRRPCDDRRRAACSSVCTHSADRRGQRLVLCRRAVATPRMARPMCGWGRDAATPARPRRLRGRRHHRRIARRGI
jgi:hypothetical protein